MATKKKREQKMSENRVMTEAEMSMARATGARVVSIETRTAEEALLFAEISGLRNRINTLATALNTSHNLTALGWNVEDTLSLATKFVELRQTQVEELAQAVKELEIASTKLRLMTA